MKTAARGVCLAVVFYFGGARGDILEEKSFY